MRYDFQAYLLATLVVFATSLAFVETSPAQEKTPKPPLESKSQTGHRFIANQGPMLCIFDSNGKLEWSMKLAGSPHDLHLLPNGNLLTHQGTEVIEVDLEKQKIVWSFDAKQLAKSEKIELHSIAPLSDEKIMVALSGERKIFEVDREGNVKHSIAMKVDQPHPHRDTRLVRPLPNGGYLVAHEGDGVVREYNRQGDVVWEFAVPMFGRDPKGGHGTEAFGNSVFSAIRLTNGNTLIGTGNGHSVLEVTPEKKIIWKVEQNDLDGITLAWVTTLEANEDGTIVIGNCHAGESNPQLIKIDRDKNVLWQFKDFKHLGNAVSNSQVLDAKGKVTR